MILWIFPSPFCSGSMWGRKQFDSHAYPGNIYTLHPSVIKIGTTQM
jgi:hypothetical protein